MSPHVSLCTVKSNVRKRPYDAAGLGRQGAVRKRKEEIHEQNGHKFVQRQFYGVVLCAFCQEFLLKAAGMQCEDCRFTCHKKCYDKVVTKCVSKTEAESVSPVRINCFLCYRADKCDSSSTGKGRRQSEPSYPTSLRTHHYPQSKLVLPLRSNRPSHTKESTSLHRMRSIMPRRLRSSRP